MPSYYPQLPSIVWQQPFFVLGLSGSVGAGKSSAAYSFRQAGAHVLDADATAKKILHSPELQGQLIAIFGEQIYDPARGSISRKRLAQIVFADNDKRVALNALIHPQVQIQFEKARSALSAGDLLVYDVPLLFETGQHRKMDMTMVVDAPRPLRYEYIRKRSGWTQAEFAQRERSQLPVKEKKQLADLVLLNTDGLKELHRTVLHIYSAIQGHRPNI